MIIINYDDEKIYKKNKIQEIHLTQLRIYIVPFNCFAKKIMNKKRQNRVKSVKEEGSRDGETMLKAKRNVFNI